MGNCLGASSSAPSTTAIDDNLPHAAPPGLTNTNTNSSLPRDSAGTNNNSSREDESVDAEANRVEQSQPQPSSQAPNRRPTIAEVNNKNNDKTIVFPTVMNQKPVVVDAARCFCMPSSPRHYTGSYFVFLLFVFLPIHPSIRWPPQKKRGVDLFPFCRTIPILRPLAMEGTGGSGSIFTNREKRYVWLNGTSSLTGC